MLFLRPGVGAEEVDAPKGSTREEPPDRIVRVGAEDAGVPEPGAFDFAVNLADPTEEALDPEDARFRLLFTEADEKRPVAATEVQLDGGVSGKEIFPGEAGEPVGGEKLVGKRERFLSGHGGRLWRD